MSFKARGHCGDMAVSREVKIRVNVHGLCSGTKTVAIVDWWPEVEVCCFNFLLSFHSSNLSTIINP